MSSRKQVGFLVRYALQSAAVIVLSASLVRVFLVSSYVMSGSAMLPSVWPGDFLVALKWGFNRPGQVVAIRCPGARDKTCMKRVVGVAGDRIEFRTGHLTLNGESSRLTPVSPELAVERLGPHSWLIWRDAGQGSTTEPVIVPPGHVFLLNDRRSDGEDSRAWGPIPVSEVEARAWLVWLSLDWFEGEQVRSWPRLRWGRLLRSID